MKFAFQIVSVLSFAAVVSSEQDGFIGFPSQSACGKDRCVKVRQKPPTELDFKSADATKDIDEGADSGAVIMDYDTYFDFADYDVMCNVCIDEVSSGRFDDLEPIYYIRDNLNCDATANSAGYVASNSQSGTPTKNLMNIGSDFLLTDVVEYRVMTADFFQDVERPSPYIEPTTIPEKYYKAGYCISNFRDYVDPCCLESESPSRQPSKAPSSAPSASPTTYVDRADPCFSYMSTVYVQDKGQTSMANVEVGDVVLTMNGFEKIYTIDHRNENEATDFVQIVTDSDNAIELTSKHLIYLHDKYDPVEAGTVRVGDKLLTGTWDAAEVSEVSVVTRNGLFNPITSSGTIVVDGIATSTYTAVDVTGGSSYLSIGGYKIISMHDFLHLAMGPFKVLCMNVPEAISSSFCLIEGGEEFNSYNKIGLRLLSFGKNQNIHVQTAIVMSLFALFVGVNLFFNPIVIMVSILYSVKTFQKTKSL